MTVYVAKIDPRGYYGSGRRTVYRLTDIGAGVINGRPHDAGIRIDRAEDIAAPDGRWVRTNTPAEWSLADIAQGETIDGVIRGLSARGYGVHTEVGR